MTDEDHMMQLCTNDADAANIENLTSKNAIYYEKNKDKIVARSKAYYVANKEKVSAQRKEYYAANKEQVIARSKAYYEDNAEQVATRGKLYREDNKEKLVARSRTYREKNAPYKLPVFGSDEHRRQMSAAGQGISYEDWEGFSTKSIYCPRFNEALTRHTDGIHQKPDIAFGQKTDKFIHDGLSFIYTGR